MIAPLHRSVPAALVVLATLVAGPIARPAAAANLLWQNAAGGMAGIAGNWNPAQVPAEADVLQFNIAGTYTVTFGALVDSVSAHGFYGGDVTLNLNTPHGIASSFAIAPGVNQVATARLTAGTLRMGTSANVGSGPNTNGTLRVSGGTANLFQNGSGTTPEMNIGGSSTATGTGEVVVLAGGALELADDIHIGRHAGSLGTLRVKGLGSTGSGLRRSRFFADSPTGDCRMGRNGAHGILEVTEGGWFRVGRDLRVAEESGDIGDITIGGENTIDSSEVRVTDDLRLCANPSTVAGQAGGAGTILVDSLGVLVVNDSTVVGDADGSSALITLRPHARFMTKHLILQQPGGGAMDLQGGLLQINGGTLTTQTGRLTVPGGSASVYERPVLELLNAAAGSFTGTSVDPPVVVGTTKSVELKVGGGSHVTAVGGDVVLGQQPSGSGHLHVVAGGQVTSDGAAVVGDGGTGSLIVESGGLATFDGVNIGLTAKLLSILSVDGSGSLLTSSGPLNVGGSTLSLGGSGSATVSDGGVLALTHPLLGGTVWGPSSLNVVGGGRIDLTGALTLRGDLNLEGGDVVGGSVLPRSSARIFGTGNVNSSILGATDTTVSIVADGGPLEIGRDTPGGNVLLRGTLNVGEESVTVVDPDSAVVGNVEIATGELHLPPGGGVIEINKRLVGDGTIYGPLVGRGYLISSGATFNGLEFAGTLYGTGQGASGGGRFTFLAGGGFEGSGSIDAFVQADSGSLIRATGDLFLGDASLPNSLGLFGRIETGEHRVVLRNSAPVGITGQVVLDGGEIDVEGGGAEIYVGELLVPESVGRVQGTGTVGASLKIYSAIAPGNPTGRLQVNGEFTLTGAASLEIELGNHAAGEGDTLAVDGPAAVYGELDLRRLPTFAAAAGDSFRILECSGLTGTFYQVTLDGAPLAGELEVHYAADGVWVVILQSTVGIGDDRPVATGVESLQLAPIGSPGAHPSVVLALPSAASVALRVYDVHGRQVSQIHDGALGAGSHRFELSRDLGGAGVFFVRAVVTEGGRSAARTTRVVQIR